MNVTPSRPSTARAVAITLTALLGTHVGLTGVAAADNADATIVVVEGAVAEGSRDATRFFELGNMRLESGDVAGAKAACERSIDLAPNFAKAHALLGCTLSRQGAYADALAALTKALELAPNDREIWENRAFAKRDAGFLRGAIEDLSVSAQLDPERAASRLVRGKLYFDLGEYDSAVTDLRAATELDPSDQDDARLYLWLALAAGGDQRAASADLAGYLAGRDRVSAQEWFPALAAFLLGTVDEVELMHIAERGGSVRVGEAHLYAGYVKLIGGESTEAADLFRRCVDSGTDNSAVHTSAVAALSRIARNSVADADVGTE